MKTAPFVDIYRYMHSDVISNTTLALWERAEERLHKSLDFMLRA
jgi:hypothetical protein